jgi:hypothetical protein
MATREPQRSVLDSQPIPVSSLKSTKRADLRREKRFYVESDGQELVTWLNAASKTRSRDRVEWIIDELNDLKRDFKSKAASLLRPGPKRPVTQKEQEIRNENTKVYRSLAIRHEALNRALFRYVFQPKATWVWANSNWLLGLCARELGKEFFVRQGHRTYGEGDAVMSVLRLSDKGFLAKICLCTTCKQQWLYAAKSHYRFCSDECRQEFYKASPDYLPRKAEIQRSYRDRLRIRSENKLRAGG